MKGSVRVGGTEREYREGEGGVRVKGSVREAVATSLRTSSLNIAPLPPPTTTTTATYHNYHYQ